MVMSAKKTYTITLPWSVRYSISTHSHMRLSKVRSDWAIRLKIAPKENYNKLNFKGGNYAFFIFNQVLGDCHVC